MTEIKPTTPLPWRTAGGDAILAGRDEALVVVGSAEREEDNSYIVTACNAYPSLLNGLREARDALEQLDEAASNFSVSDVYFEEPVFTSNCEALEKARAAVDKIEALLSQEGGK